MIRNKNLWTTLLTASLVVQTALAGTQSVTRKIASEDVNAPWAYDPGPDPQTQMGKELIDLVATQPAMPQISMKVAGDQKFRPAFGPTLWRMLQKPNTVKILFIGQDGTHIAEAAGRTATAGFGGRAQDLAAYFGVDEGAALINTFAFTIGGQYSAANSPMLSNNGNSIKFSGVTDNGMWLMAQDQDSPMVKWRNGLIDWIIRNNNESLKMIVLFGGSAKDSIATFIESKGGKVAPRTSVENISKFKFQVPDFDLKFAGGNNKFPVTLDQNGKDLAQELINEGLGFAPDSDEVSGTEGHSPLPKPITLDYKNEKHQAIAMATLQKNVTEAKDRMRLHLGGVAGSGLVHPAQLGGFDLNRTTINGTNTISLRGLPLSNGARIKNDVIVVDLPHPTYLSSIEMEKKGSASIAVAEGTKDLQPYVQNGWKIDPDEGMINEFAAGKPYRYGRTDIGPAYYDFGTPNNRMVSKSDAVRDQSNIIILGTRDRAQFDNTALQAAATVAKPAGISDEEMFSARPRDPSVRYQFDRGPGEKMARIMKENLNLSEIGKVKAGKNPTVDFIDAFNIKTHPESVGDFGHYRGTFQNPKVIILADPDGADDILTSRALTGTRGQYLHGLMEDMKVGDQYLVIKTVPFGMDGANETEWQTVLKQTSKYRAEIFKEVLKNSQPLLFIADGQYASQELKKLVNGTKVPVVNVFKIGSENGSGIAEAASYIRNDPKMSHLKYTGRMANIPRSHLGFFSRVWEGTSGSRVFSSIQKQYKGIAFAVVAPEWAFKQNVKQSETELKGVEALLKKMERNKLILPNEEYSKYLKRMKINSTEFWKKAAHSA
jgi:hypothetical protein